MTTRSDPPPSLAVFSHEKRRDWGVGILAWETRHKRAYLFENGQLRIVAEDFYRFMHEVDLPQDEVQALYTCLKRDLQAARAAEGISSALTVRPGSPTMSFSDQLAVFRAEYSGGFAGTQWTQAQRGADSPKRLACHRDAAILQANQKLGANELKARMTGQQFRAIGDDMLTVLRNTDLVPAAELACLKNDYSEHRRALATSVADLLHGPGVFGARFERFLAAFEQAFGHSAGWQLATALPALVQPAEHVCVRPTTFREQAKWMAPRLAFPKQPTASNYARALSMAKLVSNRLEDEGEHPRDLMDVHDFMRITTRPAAKKLLVSLKRARPPAAGSASKHAENEAPSA